MEVKEQTLSSILRGHEGVVHRQGGLIVKCLQDAAAINGESVRWNELAFRSPQRLPMLSHAWVSTHVANTAPGSWCVFAVFKGESLVGVLPLMIARRRQLGRDLWVLAAPCSDHIMSVDMVLAEGGEREAVQALLDGVTSAFGRSLELSLRRLHCDSPLLTIAGSGISKWYVTKEINGVGSCLNVDGTMDDYRNSLSSNFRKNLRKSAKRLSELQSVDFEFKRSDSTTDDDLRSFLQLEASGWKGREQTAILGSTAVESFYQSLVLELKRLGWLEWHFLRVTGRPIAAQMAARIDRTLVVMKIAYDETFSHISPGNMLFEKTVERAYADGDTDEINCLTDMAWHKNWKMKQRAYYDLKMSPRTAVAFVTSIAPTALKSMLRESSLAKRLVRLVRSRSAGRADG